MKMEPSYEAPWGQSLAWITFLSMYSIPTSTFYIHFSVNPPIQGIICENMRREYSLAPEVSMTPSD